MRRVLLVAACLTGFSAASPADDWPQWMGPNRDAVWNEAGILKNFKTVPKQRWKVAIGGGYSGPAVAGGKVYVADKLCRPGAGAVEPADPFALISLPAIERLLCLDAASGKEIWRHEHEVVYKMQYPCGPRCAPLVHEGKVYVLGAMGHLCCLDAVKHEKGRGRVLWSRDFPKDFGVRVPMWGFAGHPLIHGKLLICLVGSDPAKQQGGLIAFDKDTGQVKWRELILDEPGYNSPVLIESAGVTQLVVWTPRHLQGLNPETGQKYWSVKLEPKHGMSIMTPRKHGDCLFAAGIGNVGVTLQLDAKNPRKVTKLWCCNGDPDPKEGVYPINMTPFVEGGIVYGADHPGMFRAVELKTGKRLWESFEPIFGPDVPPGFKAPCGTAFVVKNSTNGLFYVFSETGDLVIGKFTPKEYRELGRTHLVNPTCTAPNGRKAVWSHPAYADKCIFARNDKQIVCVPLNAP